MASQNKGCGCFTVVAGLLIAGAGGAYLYLRGNLPWQQFNFHQASSVIPYETLAVTHVTTNQKQWSKLSDLVSPEAQKIIGSSLSIIAQSFPEENLKTLEQDILPWVEGVSLAWVGDNRLLVVVGIKDKIKAFQYQKNLGQKYTIVTTDYRNVNINQIATQGNIFYSAILNNYLVIAAEKGTIELAINAQLDNSSYQDRPGIQALRQELKLKNLLMESYIDNPSDLDPEYVEYLGQIRGFASGVGLVADGLHMQTIVKLDPSLVTSQPSSADRKFLASLPENTWLLIVGHDLKQTWGDLVTLSQNIPELEEFVREVRQGFATVSLDVDRDVFGWMDQEYAIALINSDQSTVSFGIGGLVLFKTSDPQTASNTFAQLSQLARENFITVQDRQIGRQTITEWYQDSELLLSQGWLNKQTLGVTIVTPWESLTTTNQSLVQQESFKKANRYLPQKYSQYFYLDMNQLLDIFKNNLAMYAMFLPQETLVVLESIDSIAGVNTMSQDNSRITDIVIYMNPDN